MKRFSKDKSAFYTIYVSGDYEIKKNSDMEEGQPGWYLMHDGDYVTDGATKKELVAVATAMDKESK